MCVHVRACVCMEKPDEPEEASGASITPATEGGGEEGGQGSAGTATTIVLTHSKVVRFIGGRGGHTVVW